MIYCNYCGKESKSGILYKDGFYQICSSCVSIIENHSPRKPCGDTPTQQQEWHGTNPEEGKVSKENDMPNSDTIQSKHKAEMDKNYG